MPVDEGENISKGLDFGVRLGVIIVRSLLSFALD